VIGQPFVGLLISATGMGEPVLVDHLDELWRRQIIRDQGFTYDQPRQLRAVSWRCSVPLVDVSSPGRRRSDRDRVPARRPHSPQLAAHYDQAGMVQPAIDAYRVAGARAVAISALDQAVTIFRRALSARRVATVIRS
jgi:hypothetical protein